MGHQNQDSQGKHGPVQRGRMSLGSQKGNGPGNRGGHPKERPTRRVVQRQAHLNHGQKRGDGIQHMGEGKALPLRPSPQEQHRTQDPTHGVQQPWIRRQHAPRRSPKSPRIPQNVHPPRGDDADHEGPEQAIAHHLGGKPCPTGPAFGQDETQGQAQNQGHLGYRNLQWT